MDGGPQDEYEWNESAYYQLIPCWYFIYSQSFTDYIVVGID